MVPAMLSDGKDVVRHIDVLGRYLRLLGLAAVVDSSGGPLKLPALFQESDQCLELALPIGH